MVWWWSAPQNTESKFYSFLCLCYLLPGKFPAGPRISAQCWGSRGPFKSQSDVTNTRPPRRFKLFVFKCYYMFSCYNTVKWYIKLYAKGSLKHSNSASTWYWKNTFLDCFFKLYIVFKMSIYRTEETFLNVCMPFKYDGFLGTFICTSFNSLWKMYKTCNVM